MSHLLDSPTNPELMLRAFRRWDDRVAFDGHGMRLTYRACRDLMGRMQAVMVRLGMRRGDAIAVLHANRGDAWVAGLAAIGLGLRLTPLHPLGSLADHLAIVEDAAIDHLLVDEGAFFVRGAEIVAKSDRIRTLVTLGPEEIGTDLLAAAKAHGVEEPESRPGPDDLAWITFTGGTTGRSKGVWRDHRRYAAMTRAVDAGFEWPDRPIYLAVAPNSHVGGTKIMPTLLRGGRIHCLHGFDPGRVVETIEREHISVTLLVPTMIYGLLGTPELDGTDLSSLELLLYGASPMSPSRLSEGLERIGPVFSQLYGQTECYPIAVLRRDEHDPKRPDLFASCGQPCTSVQIALLDDDGEPVPRGEAGEICVRAPNTMGGYWQREAETREAFENGWLHTSDIAWMDERGFLFIVDRKKDMIISGGFNIYPREIEDVLTAQAGVAMAAVVGVPDEKWGEAVKAFVVPHAGAPAPDPAALVAEVRAQKGAAHAPKSVEIVAEIPLTPIGKPDKKALRAPYWADRDRVVG